MSREVRFEARQSVQTLWPGSVQDKPHGAQMRIVAKDEDHRLPEGAVPNFLGRKEEAPLMDRFVVGPSPSSPLRRDVRGRGMPRAALKRARSSTSPCGLQLEHTWAEKASTSAAGSLRAHAGDSGRGRQCQHLLDAVLQLLTTAT